MINSWKTVMRILCVAEKNDAARSIAEILSRGGFRREEGLSKFNKCYRFACAVWNQQADLCMTSVSGHLRSMEFIGQYRLWPSCSPLSLFDAPIEKICLSDPIKRTLEKEARSAQALIVWTDCDREGENIGYEIIDVCKAIKPNIQIYRARFSEITPTSIHRALANLGQPDPLTSSAVDCRQELDLRIGAAFTRFQTLRLQKMFLELNEKLISYGSCQFPTLGFIVERYKQVNGFQPEYFWKLVLTHSKDGVETKFLWKRNRLFEKLPVQILLEKCLERNHATVESVHTKPTSKWRPVALNTVEFEKLASRKLRINAKQAMAVAEKLYTRGLISYPRTETNKFPPGLDLNALVNAQTGDARWGAFAQQLLQNGIHPRNGRESDQAHPPIHPTQHNNSLQGDESRIYELIVRHFLACLSADAQGVETTVQLEMAEERFSASGLIITARNYLDVYHYDTWSDRAIACYQQGEQVAPVKVEMEEGETSPPKLLSEADLIALMEKHGIGTDATHADHIETIKQRLYAGYTNGQFLPGLLGMGLVEGYDAMGFEMSKPNLRAELEADLKCICEGSKQKDQVLAAQIAKYRSIFEIAMQRVSCLDDAMKVYFGEPNLAGLQDINNGIAMRQQPQVMLCELCKVPMEVKRRQTEQSSFYIGCMAFPTCKNALWFPRDGILDVQLLDDRRCCDRCIQQHQIEVKLLKFSFRTSCFPMALPSEYTGCVRCDKDLRMWLQLDGSNSCQYSAITQQHRQAAAAGTSAAARTPASAFNHTPTATHANDTPLCVCGQTLTLKQCQNGGANLGRYFYKCMHCSIFKWQDELNSPSAAAGPPLLNLPFRASADRTFPSNNNNNNHSFSPAMPFRGIAPGAASTANARGLFSSAGHNNSNLDQAAPVPNSLVCYCGLDCKLITTRKAGPNEGRQFYTCPTHKENGGCKFFFWADGNDQPTVAASTQPAVGASTSRAARGALQCQCGFDAKLCTVRKEGPNQGRQFYVCANQQCKLFHWRNSDRDNADDISATPWLLPLAHRQNNNATASYKRPPSAMPRTSTPKKKRCGYCRQEGHMQPKCPLRKQ